MRSHDDLVRAFRSVEIDSVDPDDMLDRVHQGSARLQLASRRRVAAFSVAAAAALIVVGVIVVPTLGSDRADQGHVATTPTPTVQQGAVTLRPGALAFTLGERPAGYPGDRADTMISGIQDLIYYAFDDSGQPITLSIKLFDPERAGIAVPVLTAETVTVESLSAGLRTVNFLVTEPIPGATHPSTAVGWTFANLWLTITSNAPEDQARRDVLKAAALVDLSAVQALTFPFQIGYVPQGYEISSASRMHDPDGHVASYLGLDNGPQLGYGSELAVSADTMFNVPDGVVPNTTVGNYEAAFSPGTVESGPYLYIFDVDGFTIGIQGSLSNTEAELRQMGVTIRVLPGAANDPTVWTDQPIG